MKDFSLPSLDLCRMQAEWLAPARARILRKAEIARKKSVLDLGCGYGTITKELRQRSTDRAVALDKSLDALRGCPPPVLCADATRLPFPDRAFDFIFSQNVLLWIGNTISVVNETFRVLTPGGSWALFEPDYGGLMEDPPEISTREIWMAALTRAGAEPMIGRKLPALLADAGFECAIELLPNLFPPHPARFDFLEELPLSAREKQHLMAVRRAAKRIGPSRQLSHLPYYLIIAERR